MSLEGKQSRHCYSGGERKRAGVFFGVMQLVEIQIPPHKRWRGMFLINWITENLTQLYNVQESVNVSVCKLI